MLRYFLMPLVLALLTTSCAHRAAKSDGPERLTVLCYNIRIGAGPSGPLQAENLQENMEAIAAYIQESGADIVILQEVDYQTSRVRGMDQAGFLSERTGMHVAFARAQELSGGQYGIAALSRFPMRDLDVVELFKPDYSKTNPDWPDWYSEQRVLLSFTAETPGGPVQVLNTHLGITEGQREKQLQEIAAYIDALDPSTPLVFGGDLNTTPEEPALQPIRALLRDGWDAAGEVPAEALFTFSTTEPNRTIDYLFFNDRLAVESIEVPRVGLSDHLPIVARVRVLR